MPSQLPTQPDGRLGKTEASTVDDRRWQLACQIVDLARGLVVADNPFLSAAIGLLEAQPAGLADAFATDGRSLFVTDRKLLADFSQTRQAPTHDLVHVLVHCLLLHPFVSSSVEGASWELACDVVAESLASEVVGPREDARAGQSGAILDRLWKDFDGRLTTERLYRALREGAYASERTLWKTLFHADDHSLWPSSAQGGQAGSGKGSAGSSGAGSSGATLQAGHDAPTADKAAATSARASRQASNPQDAAGSLEDPDTREGANEPSAPTGHEAADDPSGPSDEARQAVGGTSSASEGALSPTQRAQAEDAWSRAAKSMRVDLETLSRTRGEGLGKLVRELEVGAHERVDYREFLRQFAVERENMRLSDDEFDYVFYTYGLELYGNVPLVEPLEYRNERRIRDFAIVIDTSSSVSAKVVQEFVDTTFDVLTSEGGFFSQTNIHIIQADARVQSDVKIASLADLDRWRRTIKLYGFGGTDFRPAFRYVQELRQAGEFDDLQGLVYFTDGWGIYPDRMPPYKCAFVFYDEDHRPELVPPWAIQVVLHPGEFESMSVYR